MDSKLDGGDKTADPRSRQCCQQFSCREFMKDNVFLVLTLIGIVLGFVIGLAVREAGPSDDALLWMGMPGELYIRTLKAIVLPLMVSCVVVGTADSDMKSSGRVSLITLAYIVCTNALGGLLGVAIYFIADPDPDEDSLSLKTPDTRNLQTQDIFADFIRNLFPDNIVGATIQQSQTKYKSESVVTQVNRSGVLVNVTREELTRGLGVVGSTNLVGLVVISAAFGIAASQLGDASGPFVAFFRSTKEIIFKLFGWVKWTTPVGAASLIIRNLAGVEDLSSALDFMAIFVVTVCVGNLVYQFIIIPLLHLILTQSNPLHFMKYVPKPWLLSFGPASMAVALPEMLDICKSKYKIDPRVGGFVLPTAVTLNKDGSCCFISATCLFVATYSGEEIEAGLVVTIAVLSIVSSFAIPAIPSSSIVTILVILDSMGIPPANIGFILAVEFVTDRIRTTANLTSTMNAPTVVWRWCKDKMGLVDQMEADGGLVNNGFVAAAGDDTRL